jgi:hypothetical protein
MPHYLHTLCLVECAGAPPQQTSGGVKLRLVSHHRELLDTMESRFELPAELISLNVLDRREHSDLRTIKAISERNEFILRVLRRKPVNVIQDFIQFLENTEQQHVASYLREVDINSGSNCTANYTKV